MTTAETTGGFAGVCRRRIGLVAGAACAAFAGLLLAAPAASANPFEDGCVATHGRMQGDGNLRACVWNDQAPPHQEYALYEGEFGPTAVMPPSGALSPDG
jgi:hypothetical protein